MSASPHSFPDDALLVAWLDDEVSAAERMPIEQAIANDERLRRKVALLRSVRAGLREALDVGDAAATGPRTRHPWSAWFAAAAAALVVVLVTVTRSTDVATPAAENALLELRALPLRGGWPLFAGIAFDLQGRAKTARPCRIVARTDGESDEMLAARVATDPASHTYVPLVLDAEIVLPGGRIRRGPVARVEGEFGPLVTRLRVELVDVVLPNPGISPFVATRFEQNGWAEDFLWGFARVGATDVGGRHGFVPEEAGEYQLRFVVRSFVPTSSPLFLTFPEPLVAPTAFSVGGAIGDWSEPVDGLQARVVASSSRVAADEALAIAIQLANRSDRPRAYNVAGITMPPIPQPFHFDLLVDGEPWTQRDDLGVIISSGAGFLAQPVDTIRSVVVLTDYWRRDGKRLADLPGQHTLALRFHFQPTLWDDADRSLWMGKVETPPIRIEIGAR